MVHLLLKARAEVNAAAAGGSTALHAAVRRCWSLSPLVARLLLCHRADLAAADAVGRTPLDGVRAVALQLQRLGTGPQDAASVRVRQLLDEVTERPTVDVVVLEGQRVARALFADEHNDKVMFSTEFCIGVYSLAQRRVVLMKKLKQQQLASTVEHLSVNPESGTVAVCLGLLELREGGAAASQNVFIVWPRGQLQDEEPLKFNVGVDAPACGPPLPACALLSRCRGRQTLLGRLADGKIFCWQLDAARSQLVSEAELAQRGGGAVALSDDGCWIAAAGSDEAGAPRVTVFFCEDATEGPSASPAVVAHIRKSSQVLAIQQTSERVTTCYLAVSEAAVVAGVPPPIEVYSVSVDGEVRSFYRLRAPCQCCALTFGHRTSLYLLSGHTDGLVVVYDLLHGTTSLCHDSPGARFLCMSTDGSLVLSASENSFRIFRVPAAEHPA